MAQSRFNPAHGHFNPTHSHFNAAHSHYQQRHSRRSANNTANHANCSYGNAKKLPATAAHITAAAGLKARSAVTGAGVIVDKVRAQSASATAAAAAKAKAAAKRAAYKADDVRTSLQQQQQEYDATKAALQQQQLYEAAHGQYADAHGHYDDADCEDEGDYDYDDNNDCERDNDYAHGPSRFAAHGHSLSAHGHCYNDGGDAHGHFAASAAVTGYVRAQDLEHQDHVMNGELDNAHSHFVYSAGAGAAAAAAAQGHYATDAAYVVDGNINMNNNGRSYDNSNNEYNISGADERVAVDIRVSDNVDSNNATRVSLYTKYGLDANATNTNMNTHPHPTRLSHCANTYHGNNQYELKSSRHYDKSGRHEHQQKWSRHSPALRPRFPAAVLLPEDLPLGDCEQLQQQEQDDANDHYDDEYNDALLHANSHCAHNTHASSGLTGVGAHAAAVPTAVPVGAKLTGPAALALAAAHGAPTADWFPDFSHGRPCGDLSKYPLSHSTSSKKAAVVAAAASAARAATAAVTSATQRAAGQAAAAAEAAAAAANKATLAAATAAAASKGRACKGDCGTENSDSDLASVCKPVSMHVSVSVPKATNMSCNKHSQSQCCCSHRPQS